MITFVFTVKKKKKGKRGGGGELFALIQRKILKKEPDRPSKELILTRFCSTALRASYLPRRTSLSFSSEGFQRKQLSNK